MAAVASLASACENFPGRHPHGPPPDAGIVQRLCTSDLGGPEASVVIWRDSTDAVALYDLTPDPHAKAKASVALYDSRGHEELRLPPVEAPTSPEALEVERRRESVLEDTKKGETIDCKVDAGVAAPHG